MNFVEALEFMRMVNKFRYKSLRELPKMLLHDSENDGYVVWIKMDLASKEFLGFLKETVTARELVLSKTNSYITVSSFY